MTEERKGEEMGKPKDKSLLTVYLYGKVLLNMCVLCVYSTWRVFTGLCVCLQSSICLSLYGSYPKWQVSKPVIFLQRLTSYTTGGRSKGMCTCVCSSNMKIHIIIVLFKYKQNQPFISNSNRHGLLSVIGQS